MTPKVKRMSGGYPYEYSGVVVDNNDPMKWGRIKVRVEPMFASDAVPVAAIPWATPRSILIDGAGVGFGSFSVPRVGSRVTVTFRQGDFNQPVYGGEETDPIHGIPAFALTHYPNRKGFRLENGVEVFFDETDNLVRINHPTGTYIQVATDGSVTVNSIQDASVIAGRDVIATATRDLTASATRNIIVHAGNDINITADNESNITMDGNVTIDIDGSLTATATGAIDITGATVNINP